MILREEMKIKRPEWLGQIVLHLGDVNQGIYVCGLLKLRTNTKLFLSISICPY